MVVDGTTVVSLSTTDVVTRAAVVVGEDEIGADEATGVVVVTTEISELSVDSVVLVTTTAGIEGSTSSEGPAVDPQDITIDVLAAITMTALRGEGVRKFKSKILCSTGTTSGQTISTSFKRSVMKPD